ncbi:hypothetical protein BN1195_02644 [Chryseobacterium oranimense G311]|uniref:hypothetical protein n=1 Tax=Chryseobacterium oranimense TaxID=421058 RepID=UPI0005337193|nr:hypothetical protein [Chryseobacterium oranimense]CEJ70338.1 hypothetical protein BN1195_02644 [Chryseobacterium oranimense G311]
MDLERIEKNNSNVENIVRAEIGLLATARLHRVVSYNKPLLLSNGFVYEKIYLLLNNKYNDGESYKYISQLKQGKLSKTPREANCTPLEDIIFLSLIVDKKLKKIYKICSGKVIELK